MLFLVWSYMCTLVLSCGNCKQNSAVKGRTLKIENCSISNVRTVCGVNSNRADVCTVKGLKGTPTESVCTAYQGITDPSTLPKQTSKNKKSEGSLEINTMTCCIQAVPCADDFIIANRQELCLLKKPTKLAYSQILLDLSICFFTVVVRRAPRAFLPLHFHRMPFGFAIRMHHVLHPYRGSFFLSVVLRARTIIL